MDTLLNELTTIRRTAADIQKKCNDVYSCIVYEYIIRSVPNEVWDTIFSFLKKESILWWLESRTVCKQWEICVKNVKRLAIVSTCSSKLLLFSKLNAIKFYYTSDIDIKYLTNLTKLSLDHVSTRSTDLPNLSSLIKLESFSILDSPFCVNLRDLIGSLNDSITSLKLNAPNNIRNETISKFTNLTKLSLIQTTHITSVTFLTNLQVLKITKENLSKFSYYSGNIKLIGNYSTFRGKIDSYGIGEGTVYFKRGDRYVGLITNGVPHDYGIYYFEKGSRYEGNFLYGCRQGEGTYYNSDGSVHSKGFWEADKFVG